MKKEKFESQLTKDFANYFKDAITPDIHPRFSLRTLSFMRDYPIGKTTIVGVPFEIRFEMTIPSDPNMSYSDCYLTSFSKHPREDMDQIKKDFQIWENLINIMKTNKPQILAIANARAAADHEALVYKQLDYGWDPRGYYTENTGKRVIINKKV